MFLGVWSVVVATRRLQRGNFVNLCLHFEDNYCFSISAYDCHTANECDKGVHVDNVEFMCLLGVSEEVVATTTLTQLAGNL